MNKKKINDKIKHLEAMKLRPNARIKAIDRKINELKKLC